MTVKAYLQVTMDIPQQNRGKAAQVYTEYKEIRSLEQRPNNYLFAMKMFKSYTDLTLSTMLKITWKANYLLNMFSQLYSRLGHLIPKFEFSKLKVKCNPFSIQRFPLDAIFLHYFTWALKQSFLLSAGRHFPITRRSAPLSWVAIVRRITSNACVA